MLEVVYRILGAERRGPREAGAGLFGRLALQRVVIGDAARERAHHFERVERRHALPGFRGLDARKRDVQPFRCGANREPEEQALEIGAIFPQRQARIHLPAQIVEQQRIFTQLLREQPLRQARHKDDAEGAAVALVDFHTPPKAPPA